MFTDWTMTDPRYFYARGVVYGVVLATMFWKLLVPWLHDRFRKPNAAPHGRRDSDVLCRRLVGLWCPDCDREARRMAMLEDANRRANEAIGNQADELGAIIKKYEDVVVLHGGCVCQGCNERYSLDVSVSDGAWEKIKPEGKPEGAGLLCPQCIAERLEQENAKLKAELIMREAEIERLSKENAELKGLCDVLAGGDCHSRFVDILESVGIMDDGTCRWCGKWAKDHTADSCDLKRIVESWLRVLEVTL